MKIRSELSRLWNAVFNPAPQRRSRRVNYSTCCRLEVLEDRDLLSVSPDLSCELRVASCEDAVISCELRVASCEDDFAFIPDASLQASDTVEVSELTYTALKNAIQSVNAGGTITFSPSLAGGTLTMPTTDLTIKPLYLSNIYTFSIDKNLTIDASGLNISIVGDGVMGVFTITGDIEVTLRGLTMINGGDHYLSGTTYGTPAGAVTVQSGKLTLDGCTISNSTQIGVLNYGTLEILNSTVSGNADSGIRNQGTLSVVSSEISNNANGGIINYDAATIDGCTISNSQTGVMNYFGTLEILNSTVSGNANSGIKNLGTLSVVSSVISDNAESGIANYQSATLVNSLIVNNVASSYGAGICNSSITYTSENTSTTYSASNLDIYNCTISGNWSNDSKYGYAGGLANACNTAVVNIYNSVITGNGGEASIASSAADFYNWGTMTFNNSRYGSGYLNKYVADLSAESAGFKVAPQFDSSGDLVTTPNYRLVSDSVLKDAGNNSYLTASGYSIPNDVSGVGVRTYDSTVDIGAYEYQSAIYMDQPALSVVSAPTSDSISLSWTAVDNFGYLLEYSTNSDFSASVVTQMLNSSAASATFNSLDSNQTYYFRLKALAPAGSEDYQDSLWSTVSATTATTGSLQDLIHVDWSGVFYNGAAQKPAVTTSEAISYSYTVTYNGATTNNAFPTMKNVGVYNLSICFSAAGYDDYISSSSFVISAAPVTISSLIANGRDYEAGNISATVSSYTLSGVANGENLVLSATNGVFDSDQAGMQYATFDVALNNGANALASNYVLVDSNGNAITTARTTQAALISNTAFMTPTVIYSNGILSFDWQNIGDATDYTFRYKFNNTEVNGTSYSNYYSLNLTDSYCSFGMIPGTTIQYQYKPTSGSTWSNVFTYVTDAVDVSTWNVDIDGTSTNVFTLHSKTDWATDASCKTIYLDFNGHLTYDTQWNTNYSKAVVVSPSSLDKFTAEDIYFIWKVVSEDYAIYDVDVTTQFTSLDDLLITSDSDKKYGMRAAIGGTSEDVLGLSVGGIAYEDVFSRFYGASNSSKQYSPAFVFPGSLADYEPKFVGDAISHEVGHTLGLKHDGYGNEEYYSGTSGWGPIMGDPYHQVLSQWSKGEYSGATNTTQDDVKQINEHLSFKTDNDNSASAATVLTVDSTGVCASGIITSSSSTYTFNGSQIDKDYDWYKLSLTPGIYSFAVGGEYSSADSQNVTNLNVHVDVYCDTDSNYNTVASASAHTGEDSDIVETVTLYVTTPGVYYLRVTGEGKGTPVNGVYLDGDYSDYGSLGNYSITCTLFDDHEIRSTIVTTSSDVVDSTDGLISLREAILYASGDDTVTFDSCLNGSTITLNQSEDYGALSIDKSVSIDASALSSGITIDGNDGQIFDVTDSGVLSLNGLTITGAENALLLSDGKPIGGWGGAIIAEGDVAIVNCTFNSNHAGFGSVIYTKANLTIESSVISNNSVDAYGGAIYIASNESVTTITDSQFVSNSSGTLYNTYGGAILNLGNLTISGCEFTSNSASYFGGAIYHEGYVSTLTISDSVFSGNIASGRDSCGGAVMLNNCGSTVIANSLFFNNAAFYGSAVYNNVYDYANENNDFSSAIFTLVNVTIAKNYATNGGALYSVSNAYLYNTIVQADAGLAVYKMQGDTGTGSMWGQNNLISSMYGSFTAGDETVDGGYSTGSPTFVNASGNYSLKSDFALTPNSLGVDDGDNAIAAQFGLTSQTNDIIGDSRIYDNTSIDLGAFESQTIAQPLDAPVASSSVSGTNVTISWSAVENASTYTVSYQITGDEMTDSPWYTISGLTSQSFTLPRLINGVTVTARVQADGTDVYAKSSSSETRCSIAALDLSGYNVDLDGDGVKETNVFNLSSKADSNYTIYLDFTGHLITSTGWNGDEYGDIIRVDASVGSYYSADDILYIWRTTAEDYAPFDVNVTTVFPGMDAILYDNTESDLQWGKRVVIGNNYCMNSDNSSPTNSNVTTSGVAFAGTFQEMVDDVAFVWLRGKKNDAESVSHESGHTLGLYHDGSSAYSGNSVYFSGREYWAPIMGSGYSYSMVQWTMGEYPGAQTVTNNSGETLNKLDSCQNELLVISSHIPFIDDDVASVSADGTNTLDGTPTVLLDSAPDYGQSTEISYTGMIGRQAIGEGEDAVLADPDNDVYTLALGVGAVDLTIKGVDCFGYAYSEMGYSYNLTNLDVKAELFDSEWNSVYVYDSDWSSDAAIQCDIAVAGTYYLVISGDQRGELGDDGGYWYTDKNGATKLGYSNYGSLGRYKIAGSVTTSALKEITDVSFVGYTGTYDGAAHDLIQSVAGLEDGDVVTYSTDNVQWTSTLPKATNAGEYSVWVKVERVGYEDYASSEIVSTIDKALLTATADNQSITYGDAAPVYTVTYTGFVNSENKSVIDALASAKSNYIQYNNAGEYAISVSGASDNNYEFAYEYGTLNVGQKAVTVTFDDYSGLIYNGQERTISTEVFGMVNNDNVGLSLSYNKTVKDAGSYTATASISNANYTLTGTTTQDFSIGKATLTAKAENMSITYGDAAPGYTVTYTGFVNGENSSVIDTLAVATSSYAQYNSVGEYPINVSGASDNNYNFVYHSGSLTVGQKSVTVAFDDYNELIYNGQMRTISAAVSGIVNNDNAGLTLSYDKAVKDAGSYTAAASISNENYVLIGTTTQSFSIDKATLTATADNKLITYGDAAPAFTVTYSGFVNDENAAVIDTTASATSSYIRYNNVGSYTINVSGASDNNYIFVYQTGTLTVGHKAVTVSFDGYSGLAYTGQIQTISATVSGTVNNDNAGLSLSYNKTVKDAGAYTATASISNANYVLTGTTMQNFSIGKATLTATADNKSIVYGDAAAVYTVTYSGFVNGENLAVIDTTAAATSDYAQYDDAGEYPISVSGASDNNYDFVYQAGTLNVDQKPVTVTFDDYSGLVYNGQERTISATVSGTVNSDNVGLALSYSKTVKDAGSYTATAAISNTNYVLTGTTTQNFSIRKATLIATADNKSITYGDAAPAYTVTYAGFVNGENKTVINSLASASSSYVQYSDIGDYEISASGASDNNYDFVYQKGILTVCQKAVTVSFDNYEGLIYNGQEQIISATVSGTVNNDNSGLSLSYDKIVKNAGSYIATASISNSNYILTGATAQNFSIDKATLTATADNKSITYGDAAPVYTVTYTGFVSGEDASVINTCPTALSPYDQFSNVGEYVIEVGSGSDSNYKFVYETGSLTVEQKPVTVSFGDYEGLIYNGQERTISASVSGTVNGDNLGLSLSYNKTVKDAGAYTAAASISNENYVLTETTTQNFSIGKATLTATADDKSITYGDAAPTYTVTYSGFVNGENKSVIDTLSTATSSYTQFDNVGEYEITALGASDNNYDFEYQSGTLTIDQKSVTVSFDDYNELIYNGQEQAISAEVSGTVNGDNPGLSLSYNKIVKDAGSYTATASISNSNYILTGTTIQNFSIGKATLIVSADNLSFTYGDAVPEYTVSYTGFVNGENESVIDTRATATSSYVQFDNVGDYSINVYGAEDNNYDFVYQTGTLNVGQKAVMVSFDDYEGLIYNGQEQSIAASISGTVNGDNPGLSLSYNKTVKDADAYTATASISNDNYILTGTTIQNFSIGKATLIVSADNLSFTYGDAVPEYTVSYTGFVNGENESVIDTRATATSSYVQFDNVGDYSINVYGAEDNNYDFVYQTGTLNVGQKAVMVSFDDYEGLIYNGQEQSIAASISGTVNGDNPGLSLMYDKTVKDAGSYTATASISNENYVLTGTMMQNFSIGKATLTVSADNQSIAYGDAVPEYTVSYAGFVIGEDESVIDTPASAASSYAQFDNVGEYTITTSGALDINYDFVYQTGNLTVGQKTVTVSFDNYQGLVYNGQEQTVSAAVSGAVNNYDPGLSLSYNKLVKDAGAYTATASISNDNYILTGTTTQNFSVGKALLTATADDKLITYGDAAPVYTVTYSGFVNGEDESVIDTVATASSSYAQYDSIGAYTITASGASDNNYDFEYQSGALTVDQKSVTVSFSDYEGLIYNGQDRSISAAVSGTVNNDEVGLSLSYDKTVKDAGLYTAAALISNGNYVLTGTTSQNFSIGMALLTATADDKLITYGDAAPVYTVTYSGFVNGEDESVIDTLATASSNYAQFDDVGEYVIAISSAEDNNYDFVYQSGTLTVELSPVSFYGSIQTQQSKTNIDQTTSADAIPQSINAVDSWTEFYLEIWTDSYVFQPCTTSIVYDSTIYAPDLSSLQSPAGVDVVINSIDDADPRVTTMSITVSPLELSVSEGTAFLMAQLEFKPVSSIDDPNGGLPINSTGSPISVGSNEVETAIVPYDYDLNSDERVDVNDFILFASVYGMKTDETSINSSPLSDQMKQVACAADFDNDGSVNVDDFILFAINFGTVKKNAQTPAALPASLPTNLFAALTPQTTVEQTNSVELAPDPVEPIESPAPVLLPRVAIQSAEFYQLKPADVISVASLEKTTSVTAIPKSDSVPVQVCDAALNSFDFTSQKTNINLNEISGLFITEDYQSTSDVNLVDAALDELDVEFEWEDMI